MRHLGMAAWGMVFVGALALLGKPWLSKYLEEKGKNLANKEDFNSLLEQLKTTTSETEKIKQLLAREGWLAQQRWGKREEKYIKLLRCLRSTRRVIYELLRTPLEDPSIDNDLWMKFEQELFDLESELAFASIFISDQDFNKKIVTIIDVNVAGKNRRDGLNCIADVCAGAERDLLKIARADLQKLEGGV
jgi:hypothetical protein